MFKISSSKNSLVVPTDKTSSFRIIDKDAYSKSTTNHLLKSGHKVS